jgi:peptidoglycan hydrolase CwlO-like protein
MKTLFALSFACVFVFSACATTKPIDRSDQAEEYTTEEAANQERSLERSEQMSKVKALDSQISAIDSQIKNQQNVIAQWRKQPEVASSRAMIDNAKVRIRHLKEERERLVAIRKEAEEELED